MLFKNIQQSKHFTGMSLAILLITALFFGGCNSLSGPDQPTAFPTESIGTAVVLTIEASRGLPEAAVPSAISALENTTPQASQPDTPNLAPAEISPPPLISLPLPGSAETDQSISATPSPVPASGQSLTSTATLPEQTEATQLITDNLPLPSSGNYPFSSTLPLTAPLANTPVPEIPAASIQIYKLGDLSKVTSPLRVYAYLKPGSVGHQVQIELRGEDGRVLVRQVRFFKANPKAWADVSAKIDFEIRAAAEVGRLIFSVYDDRNQIMALNSVDLILLSAGESDINPSSALLENIFVQQPVPKALIQGGTVLVSGLVQPSTNHPLMVQLITPEGHVVGQRLVSVTVAPDGSYTPFAVEVPYTVSQLTPVRLILNDDGENISEMRHLSSVEVLLSP
jgi:hypothetical protein